MTASAVYIGSYTPGSGGTPTGAGLGISLVDREADGALTDLRLVARTEAPGFLALHPAGRVLYAVHERDNGPGEVSAFEVHDDGTLSVATSLPTDGSPAHLTVHPGGGHVLAANYVGGSVVVFELAGDGTLAGRTDLWQLTGSGPDPDRQEAPHAHEVRVDPAGGHVLVSDLGTDRLHVLDLDTDTGRLAVAAEAGQTEPGAGPRHFAFDPAGYVHVACELSSEVTTFRYDAASGELTRVAAVPATAGPVPEGVRNYPSEIAVSADGRFAYVANRGTDVVTAFTLADGAVTAVADVPTGGAWPRHLLLVDPDLYVANQHSSTVTRFRVDADTGIPAPAGPPLRVPSPACLLPTLG